MKHNTLRTAASLTACLLSAVIVICGCQKDKLDPAKAASAAVTEGDFELTIEVNYEPRTKTDISLDATNNKLPVLWNKDDTLYVAGETDGYLGFLTNTETTSKATAKFKGNVKGWTTAQDIHVYYLGKFKTKPTFTDNQFTFDISKQGGTLAAIADSGHIAHAVSEDVPAGTHTIPDTTTLKNLNAVILYDLSAWTSGVEISGTYNSATLDLKTGAFKSDGYTTGDIALASDKCTATTYVTFIPDNKALTFKKGRASTPTKANNVEAGKFYSNASAAIVIPKFEDPSLPGLFSVSPTKQVYFSRGNLYWDGSTYKFESNQYDFPNTWNTSHVGHLFCVKNTETSINPYDGKYGTPAPSNTANDVFFTNATKTSPRADFTVNNQTGVWRMLSGGTDGELQYLLETRPDAAQKVGFATVVGVNGLIILPDTFTDPKTNTAVGVVDGAFVPKLSTGWDSNVYTDDNWAAMESAGAVFLPYCGSRDGSTTSGGQTIDYINTCYMASSAQSKDYAYWLHFTSTEIHPANYRQRSRGCAVRLVKDAPLQHYFEGEYDYGEGVKINGTIWAPVNCGIGGMISGETKNQYPYGKLFQWGRKYPCDYNASWTDGNGSHSAETVIQTAANGPIAESSEKSTEFYTTPDWPHDWLSPKNDNRWTVLGNNPCPNGWRVPTKSELTALIANKSGWKSGVSAVNGQNGYYFSGSNTYSETVPNIFLPAAGLRSSDNTSNHRGSNGCYYSSDVSGDYAYYYSFKSSEYNWETSRRANGCSVRCVYAGE